MAKFILPILLIGGLTACSEYEGRKTNCWSGKAKASIIEASDAPVTRNCTDWYELPG